MSSLLAFDRQQRRAPDRAADRRRRPPVELAAGERVLLENVLHGLQVELGGQVGDREVLVVERARSPRPSSIRRSPGRRKAP